MIKLKIIVLLLEVSYIVWSQHTIGRGYNFDKQTMRYEEKEILLLPDKLNYKRAEKLCKRKGYHIITIENEDINKLVYDMAVSNKTGSYWIDVNDKKEEGKFRDLHGERIAYKNFAKGEPNNYLNEDCVHGLFYPDGLWNDISCSSRNAVICSKEKITEDEKRNSTYQIYPGRVSYQEALEFCYKHNCRIITIENEQKNNRIFEIAQNAKIGPYWINGNDMAIEGRWLDSFGKSLKYLNWYEGEPNNYLNEDCLQGAFYIDGKWNDISCNSKNAFIYEFEDRTNQEIILHTMNSKLNYESSSALCQSKGLKMVRIEDDKTNNIVHDFASKNNLGTFWIDANDIKEENKFVYSDGQNIKYRKFSAGVPDNVNDEDCVVGLYYPNGYWNDISCSSKHSVLCFEDKSKIGINEVTESDFGKYFVHSSKVTYQEALDYCYLHNCRLVTVQNSKTDAILMQLANRYGIATYWLDGTDTKVEGLWLNDEGEKLSYLNWIDGEPNNWQDEDCLLGNFLKGGKWNDISCQSRNSFIYEFIDVVVNSTDLEYLIEYLTYQEAQAFCENKGYSLLTISNEETNKKVQDLVLKNKIGQYWIDANDIKKEGVFSDSDGNKIKYSKFNKGEPNNNGNEDCVHGSFYPNGYWNDIDCSTKNMVICMKYRPPIISVDAHNSFHIYKQKVTYEEAHKLCRSTDFDLLEIDDIEDNIIIYNLILKNHIETYWIEGTDSKSEGNWVFPNGKQLEYINWMQKERINDTKKNCLYSSNILKGKWQDISCSSKHSVICFKDAKEIIKGESVDEINYLIHKEEVTFEEALNFCKNNSCQLVTIDDRDTDIKIRNLALSLKIERYWIEGNDKKEEGTWVNTEGRKLIYFNWSNGQPGSNKSQNCLVGNFYPDGKWKDMDCNTKNPFIYRIIFEEEITCLTE